MDRPGPINAGRTRFFEGARLLEVSLSIVLPVHNAQATLRHDVLSVLEIADPLGDRLEVLILDDGSTDDTIEVAHELVTCYPQVKVVRHRVRRGLGPMIKTALAHTTGATVMVHTSVGGVDAEQIWSQLHRPRDQRSPISMRVEHAGTLRKGNPMPPSTLVNSFTIHDGQPAANHFLQFRR